MGLTVNSFRGPDLAVLGVAGATMLFALFGSCYTIPWRRRSRRAEGTKMYNVFWQGRAVLELFSALWVAVQLLRLGSVWGKNSIIFPDIVTDWTAAGWFCRIYLTAALGFFQPFCSLMTLLMFVGVVSQKPSLPQSEPEGQGGSSGLKKSCSLVKLCIGAISPKAHLPQQEPIGSRSSGSSSSGSSDAAKQGGSARGSQPNRRLVGLSLLATLPALAAQAVIAWLGLVIRYQGKPPEEQPHSVLGYFFAAFWHGDAQQCDGQLGCTLCVFPAAAVIAHAVFSVAYLVALWVTSSRMAAAVLNKRLKRRLRFFQWAASLLVVAGAGALGGSVAQGPFSWVNQGCWLGYFASVAATVALVSWEVVIWPVHDLSALNKRLKQWTDPRDGPADSPSSDGYIKAVPRPQSLGEQRGSAADLVVAAGQPAPATSTAASHGLQLL